MPSSDDTDYVAVECPPVPTKLLEHLESVFDMGPPRVNETPDAMRFRAGACAVITFLRARHDAQQEDGAMGKVL